VLQCDAREWPIRQGSQGSQSISCHKLLRATRAQRTDIALFPRLIRSLYDNPKLLLRNPDNPDTADKREGNARKSVAFHAVRVECSPMALPRLP
jgi:hypothetical protein